MKYNYLVKYTLPHMVTTFVGGIVVSISTIYIVGCDNIFFLHNEEAHTKTTISKSVTPSTITEKKVAIEGVEIEAIPVVENNNNLIIEEVNSIEESIIPESDETMENVASSNEITENRVEGKIDKLDGIQKDFKKEYNYEEKTLDGKEISVSNVSELQQALSKAEGGEKILMKSGIYNDIVIYGKEFVTNPVTLIGEEGTIIESLKINHSQGMVLRNIGFFHIKQEGDEDWTRIVALNKSSDIHLIENEFMGSDDGEAFNDVTGLGIRTSKDIIIYNNSFKSLSKGVVVDDGTKIIISENNFSELNIDGVNVAGGSKNVLVEGNDFRDFYTCDIFDEETCKNHPDFIQLYNDTGKKSNEDIRILSNTMIQGAGSSIQSVFIQTNNPGFNNKNVTVANNLIYNSHSHGITVYNTDGIDIHNNTVLKTLKAPNKDINIPNINLNNTTAARLGNNISISPYLNKGSTIEFSENNSLITTADYADMYRIDSTPLKRDNFYIK